MLSDSERLHMQVLQAVAPAGAPLGDVPTVDGMSRDEILAVLDQLLVVGHVAAIPLRGDDRLLSVRDLRVTPEGEQWLNQIARRARPAPEAGSRGAVPLDEKRRRRAEFMQLLYDQVDGGVMPSVPSETIGSEMGLSPTETDAVVEYLANEGLVEFVGGGEVSLMHGGVREVEQARSAPEQSTEHFPPYVSLHVEGNVYGLQAGTIGSTQTVIVDLADQRPAIDAFIVEMRQQLGRFPISAEEREIVEADLDTVEAQIRSPKPRLSVLRETLASLRAVAEGAAGSGAFAALLELAHHIHL